MCTCSYVWCDTGVHVCVCQEDTRRDLAHGLPKRCDSALRTAPRRLTAAGAPSPRVVLLHFHSAWAGHVQKVRGSSLCCYYEAHFSFPSTPVVWSYCMVAPMDSANGGGGRASPPLVVSLSRSRVTTQKRTPQPSTRLRRPVECIPSDCGLWRAHLRHWSRPGSREVPWRCRAPSYLSCRFAGQ